MASRHLRAERAGIAEPDDRGDLRRREPRAVRRDAELVRALGELVEHELAGGVPVMAHVGADMPPRLEDIVDPLRPGDIVTHCCTPKMNRPITSKGQLRDCMLAARARGVDGDEEEDGEEGGG